MKSLLLALAALLVGSLLVAGCGGGWNKPTSKPAVTRLTPPPSGKPTQAMLQWGPKDAKVRLVGYFYISPDPRYQRHIALFESLAKQYPKQLYVQYWDLRTLGGQQARANGGPSQGSPGLLINGQSEIPLHTTPARTVAFSQEMGRFWTEQDLREAVAEAIKQQYGK